MNWISAIIGVVITAFVGFGLHTIDVNHINKKHATELTAQAVNLNSQCAAAKAITEKVSNELQSNLVTLNNDSDTLVRLLTSAQCGIPSGLDAGAVTGYDATPAGKELIARIGRAFEPNRVTVIVKKGEKYRVQLKACQTWAAETWQASQNQK